MKPDACSIGLFHRDEVLLIQRAYAPFTGLWTFPGGRMEAGETPVECVQRELFEETRLIVTDPVQVLVETVGCMWTRCRPIAPRTTLSESSGHAP
jgi:ADP-ribose pyrophosphatase YjhB (NUDIX family)